MKRQVVVMLWDGAVVVRPVGLSRDGQVASVAALSDATIERSLRKLNVTPLPATPDERRTRLRDWPTQADVDTIATSWTARNGGVRPRVRILEVATLPSGLSGGPAGTMIR